MRDLSVGRRAPTRLLVLDRDGFVDAVTGHRPTDDLARERVARLHAPDEGHPVPGGVADGT